MKIVFSIIIHLICCIPLFAQVPQIYIHTDRSIYSAGDTVWFKAYLMKDLKLDSSKLNLYVNWGTVDGNVHESNVYLAGDGYSFGQYVIPANFNKNHILLNGFTGDIADRTSLGYYKYLDVITADTKVTSKINQQYHLKITSLGGDLIKDSINTILLRSENNIGESFIYDAELLNKDFQVLQTLRSDSIGYASFNFIPKAEPYLIRWKNPIGDINTIELPVVQHDGVKIYIAEENDAYYVSLKSFNKKISEGKIVGRFNQTIVFEKNIADGTDSSRLRIPKNELGFGILNVAYLKGQSSLPTCNAVELINYEHVLIEPKIDVVLSNKDRKSKQEITLLLPEGLDANLSVAITSTSEMSLKSDHMLDAVIGSQFYNSYNFNNQLSNLPFWTKTNKIKSEYSFIDTLTSYKDHVLYAKGKVIMEDKKWKEYDTYIDKLVQGKKKSKYIFNPRSLSIGYHPIKDDTITYPFRYDHVLLEKDRTFSYKQLQFFDTMEFKLSHVHRYTQYADLDVSYRFKPFDDFTTLEVPEFFKDSANYESNIDLLLAQNPNFLKNRNFNKNIDIVNVNARRKRFEVLELEKQLMVSEFFRNSMEDILPQEDKYIQKYSVSIGDYLARNYSHQKFDIRYINERLILDNNPNDQQLLNETLQLDASWFAMLKILNSTRGRSEFALYTFAPENVNREIGRKIKKNKLMGYSSIANITNKTYEGEFDKNLPDNRITLYWHPLLIWKAGGKNINLTFYTSDNTDGYWITVKGVTIDGRVIDYKKKVTY